MPNLSALAASQPRIVAVLRAALASQRLHHGYLFVEPEEGAGRELALAVAGALVCDSPAEADACGICAGCRQHAAGGHPDVIVLGPNDKGIIAVEEVREVSRRVALKAIRAAHKAVVILGADLANPQAQNALLKTLEEPPGDTIFLLVAGRARSLLPTVRSRCVTMRLAPSDRLHAHAALEQAGITPALARVLGPLVGERADRAQALVELGLEEILRTLEGALEPRADVTTATAAAADLGQNRERADLALALLEVRLRDALARERGATDEQLFDPTHVVRLDAARLAAAAARLTVLRRLGALHLNRTLAVEAVLRDLGAGQGAAS